MAPASHAQPADATDAPLPYAAAVAARFAPPPLRYDTPGLQPGRASFTSNAELSAELLALSRSPAAGSAPPPRLLQPGVSGAGEPLLALHFSHGPGRPAVLLQGQQHGNEPAGSEALLALAQQLAGGAFAAVLDRIDIVVLPRANPDGAALGQRRGAQGLDINRDHLLLRTPEAQALALLVQQFDPLLVVDAHEHTVLGNFEQKFNAVQRDDLLYQHAMTANLPPALQQASEQWFHQPLLQALAQQGLTTEWYYTTPLAPGDLRLAMGSIQPDTARNVHGLQNRVAVLLETRGVGIGRLDIQRRVHAQVVALTSLLHSAAEHAGDLLALRRQLQAEVAAAACQGSVVVLAAQTPTRRELLMLDPVSGADKAVAVLWQSSLQLRPLLQRARPCGYWLSAESLDALQRLRQLGLQLHQLPAATELQAEAWRETARISVARTDGRTDGRAGGLTDRREDGRTDGREDGRTDARTDARSDARSATATATEGTDSGPRLVQVAVEPLRLTVPAGSWYLPLDQPLAHLAVAALEPDTPSSWFANRVLPALGSTARVMVPVGPSAPP